MGLRTVVRMPHSISSSGWPVTIVVADSTLPTVQTSCFPSPPVRVAFGVWVSIKILFYYFSPFLIISFFFFGFCLPSLGHAVQPEIFSSSMRIESLHAVHEHLERIMIVYSLYFLFCFSFPSPVGV